MRDQRLFALSSRLTRLETVRILRKLPTTNNRSISCVNYSPYSKRPKFTLYTDWIECMYLVVLTMVLIHSSLRCIFKFNLASWFIHVIRCYFQVNTFQMQIFTVFKFEYFFFHDFQSDTISLCNSRSTILIVAFSVPGCLFA